MNVAMNHEAAQNAYAQAHAQCLAYLETLNARVENADAPDDATDWSDVANMAHLADQLREIVEPE